MATMRLYPVSAATLVLRSLPVATIASTVLYLTPVESPATTLVLRPVNTQPPAEGSFPTQYAGLRYWNGTSVVSLCLVAAGDAPAGDAPMLRKNGVTYAVYLVDTTDGDASPVRMRTNDGTKAIRLLT